MSEIFGKEKSEWKLSQKEPDLQKSISLMSEQGYSSNCVCDFQNNSSGYDFVQNCWLRKKFSRLSPRKM